MGPKGGASYRSDIGLIDAETTSQIKVADLMIPTYGEFHNLSPTS